MGGGIGNYGADSEVEGYLVNRDGTFDYGGISDATEIEAYKVPGEENLIRKNQGKEARTLSNSDTK